ncbi:MAG: flagellar hook-length control protein FliK [Hyphomicrobiales bacterium]|nr:flagellar hook-length control protein FliK [Hyphomicrobiales bacterium]
MSQHTQISAAGGIPPAERPARQNGKDTAAVGGFPFQSLLNTGAMAQAPANFALRANQQIVLNLTSELSTGPENRRETQVSAQDRASRSSHLEHQPTDTASAAVDDVDSPPDSDTRDQDQAESDADAALAPIVPKDALDVSLNAARSDAADGPASGRAPLPPGEQPGLNANRDTGAPQSRSAEPAADLPGNANLTQARESAAKPHPDGTARQSAASQEPTMRAAEAEKALSQVHRTPVHISVVDNTSRLVSGPSASLLRSTDVNLQTGSTTAATVTTSAGQNGTQSGGQNAGSQNNPQQGLPFGAAAAAQAANAGITGLGSQATGEGKSGFATTAVNSLGSQNGSLLNATLSGQVPSAAVPSSMDVRGTTPSGLHQASTMAPTPVRAEPQEIGVQITRAAKSGIDRISIDLKPESLGRIEVRLELGHDGRVSALILADSKDTLEMLRADSRALQQNLQDAGLKMDGQSLQFDLRSNHGGPQRENMPAPHMDPSNLQRDAGISADELALSGAHYGAEYSPVFSDNQVNVLA